ncbi:cell death abnormality protein 1-like isoform X3 [Ischnura elegans]|uniref:cell death abnormality protein 1-like isoform X3 n=1 Tax=Ischnura elegans TaxID=197161 RepID=UPI001ED89A6C|nr:cell death abnormality protein 1-like isoform X3 [Ischnura elegans]
MKYSSLFVGALILAVALPLCCGYYVVDGPQADDATIGSACNDGKGCETVTGSKCSIGTGKGICICIDGMIPNGDGKSCVSGVATVGSTCFNNIGCEKVTESKCNADTGMGKCICNDGKIPNGDGKSCAAGDATVGSTCFNNIGCEKVTESKCNADTGMGKCICNDGKIPNGDGKSCAAGTAGIGSSCFMNIGCETVANAKCSSSDGKGQCTCNDGYHDQGDTCAQDTKLGDACGKDNICTGSTECTSEGFCTCKAGFHAGDDLLCITGNATIGSTCKENLGCEQVIGLKCDAENVTGNCSCDHGFYASEDGLTCANVIGSTCNDNATCEARLSNTECNGDKCQCKSGYLEKSGICEPGAGSSCSETDTCGDKYATCTDGKCQCKANYTAMEGVCRPGLNEKCDDTDNPCSDLFADCGKNSTCVCQDKYEEKDNKCLAPYNMACTPDDGCITARAQCTNNTQTMEWMCLCPNKEKYLKDDDKCSGSIATLTLWAAILSISLRFIM